MFLLFAAIGAPNSAARRVRQRNVRRANTQAAEAEALEALAEIAAGSPMRKRPGNDGAPDSQSDADNVSSERHNNGEYAAPAGDSDAREFGERQGENE